MSVDTEEARDEIATPKTDGGEIFASDDEFDDDLLPDDSEVDLDEFDDIDEPEDHEIRAGGASRVDKSGNIYWLNLDQLREFNRMDRTILNDTDFWAWFDAAISTWGKRSTGKQERSRGKLSGMASSWSSPSWEKPKKFLSDWWGGGSYGFFGGNNKEERRLAIAVQAVQTTVRVIDNHERRMNVRLTDEGQMQPGAPRSYTSFDERQIVVSPMALNDTKLEEGERIDVTTGWALHEASHAEHTEPTMKTLLQPTRLRPVSIASFLHNLLEDVRIEALTTENFPGFAGYFEKSLGYLWEIGKDKAVTDNLKTGLQERIRVAVLAAKWYDQYRPLATDATLQAEIEWWHDWVERYRTDKKEMRRCLIDGLKRLAEDDDAKDEMDKMEAEEKAAEAAQGSMKNEPEILRKMIEDMLKKHGLGEMPSCTSGSGGRIFDPSGKRKPAIGAPEAERIETMVKSEIEEGEIKDFKIPEAKGCTNPKMVILHPPETPTSRGLYQPADNRLIARMKNVFHFKPSGAEEVDKLLRTGQIDEDELWRGGMGDYRMFGQKIVARTPQTNITLLIDASGSMRGTLRAGGRNISKVNMAIELAQVMHACLKDMNGVRVRVRAHSGDNDDIGNGVAIYKIWEHGEAVTRLSLMKEIDNGDNYDGFALGWCMRELMLDTRPDEQNVVIVLSDGYPAGHGYGGVEANEHLRSVVKWGEQHDIDTIQVAIQGGMNQAEMYKHFVMFESAEKLPAQMTMLLRKIFPYN